jgi:small subunit ribosomal protein S6
MSAAAQLAREYELVYILRPNVGPSEARKVSERITGIVEKGGAKLTRVDNWGKRKLAYPIEKNTRGIFVYVTFVAPTDLVAEIERNLRILDPVIRYQTVRLEALHDLSELTIDPSEVEFVDIEASEDEDDDPSFEETLGMSAPRAKADEDEAKAESDGDDDADDDSDDSDDDSDDSNDSDDSDDADDADSDDEED